MAAPLRLARDTACNFLTIAVGSGLGLAVTSLAAHGLQPERMGLYTLLSWVAAIAALVANLGTVTATMKYMAEALGRHDEAEAAGILACTVRQVTGVGLLVAMSLAVLGPGWITGMGHGELVAALWLAALGVLPTALVALGTSACQALRRYDQVAGITSLCALTNLAGTLLALRSGAGIVGLVAAGTLSMTVGAIGFGVALGRWRFGWWHAPLAAPKRQELSRYQGPVFVMLALDAIVWQRSEVFFLGAYSPQREVAFYGLAFSLASMAMRLIPGTLIGLLLPNMSRAMGEGDEGSVARIFQLSCRAMAMLAFPVAIGGSLLAPALVQLLYGPGYEPIAALLSMLLVANAGVMIFGFPASSLLYATDQQARLVKVGLVVSLLNLLLAWWWIPLAGAWGAVASCSIAQLSSLAPGMRLAHRRLGVSAPWGAILKVAAAGAVMALPVAAITRGVPGPWALLLAPLVGAPCYFVALWAFGALEENDRQAIAKLLERFRSRGAPGANAP